MTGHKGDQHRWAELEQGWKGRPKSTLSESLRVGSRSQDRCMRLWLCAPPHAPPLAFLLHHLHSQNTEIVSRTSRVRVLRQNSKKETFFKAWL